MKLKTHLKPRHILFCLTRKQGGTVNNLFSLKFYFLLAATWLATAEVTSSLN